MFSEVAPQAGAEHHEVSVLVVDILDGGLHCQDSVHLPSPRSLHGVFRPLKESGVLARESAFVQTVPVGGTQLRIPVARIPLAGVLGILCHAGDAPLVGLP